MSGKYFDILEIETALKYAYALVEDDNSPIVEGAYVTCNQSMSVFLDEPISAYASAENNNTRNGAAGLRATDIVLKPETLGVCRVSGEACKPDIEGSKWQDCDEAHRISGEAGVTMNSYMVCLKGGIISPFTDGQRIEGLMEKKFPEYVTLEQLQQLGWYEPDAKLVFELNRLLEKHDITTTERIRHFLAQCMKETNKGMWLREGDDRKWESQEACENSFNTEKKYGYKYRGAGYIQLTWKYHYLAFATYMIQQEYPELNVIVLPPAHNSLDEIQKNYDQVVANAKEEGRNIEKYEKIVSEGCDYVVAEGYAWEVAGYFWETGACNDIVDGLESNDPESVDKVTEVVNFYTPSESYQERVDNYKELMMVIQ